MFKTFVSLLALATSALANTERPYVVPAQGKLNSRLRMMQGNHGGYAAAPVYDAPAMEQATYEEPAMYAPTGYGGGYGEPAVYYDEPPASDNGSNGIIAIIFIVLFLLLIIGFLIALCWFQRWCGLNQTTTTTTTTA